MSKRATNDGKPTRARDTAVARERWAEAVRASAGLPITPALARADLDAGMTVEEIRAKYGATTA